MLLNMLIWSFCHQDLVFSFHKMIKQKVSNLLAQKFSNFLAKFYSSKNGEKGGSYYPGLLYQLGFKQIYTLFLPYCY